MQKSIVLKGVILYCLLLLTFSVKAYITLDYEPKGIVIPFNFESLKIYSDTTSVFYIYKKFEKEEDNQYLTRIRSLILKQIKETQSDTVIFSGEYIPFNDTVNNKWVKEWYINWLILNLTKENRLKIFDQSNKPIKSIQTKKTGTRRNGYVARIYLNKDTKKELFREVLFYMSVVPKF